MLDFKHITVSDREKVQRHTFACEYRNCDLAFANLFVWQFLYDTQIAFDDNFMYVKYRYHNKLYYMLPVGKGDLIKAIDTIIEDSTFENQRFCLQGLSPKMKACVEKLLPDKFCFSSNRDYCDYLYLRKDLAELTGKRFQSKRNHINQFKRNYPNYEFLEITPKIVPQCLELEWLWESKNINPQEEITLEAERKAITNAFENYQALQLSGGALRVDNKIVAFTFGSPISWQTFDVAVEKADTQIVGAYTVINNEFAKRISSSFIYLNREEDLGLEGLRKAKLSYQPVDILEKFTAHPITP
ncbi:MAG: phosphatidylglycerol lysyltransferase domain-containing protein [Prevotellaceae bacterium]|jgi:hypothetical protein|nr:phosphatidylglycerol lysyltransferase domain-containing protein [Prevotellaceae bacterium]